MHTKNKSINLEQTAYFRDSRNKEIFFRKKDKYPIVFENPEGVIKIKVDKDGWLILLQGNHNVIIKRDELDLLKQAIQKAEEIKS